MNYLSPDFLSELAKSCILSEELLSIVRMHLKYSYIEQEPYKQVFKYMFDYHSANKKSPTIGLISENVKSVKTLPVIGAIRQANVYDTKQQIIETFEQYIKTNQFFELHAKTADLFNANKKDEAIEVLAKESKNINEFSLKRQLIPRIFADYEKRQEERVNKDFTSSKIPTGIPALDYHTRGGIDRGTGILGVGRSGAGKTTFLRSLGGNAAFRGINVLHIAAGDSTQQEVQDGYDAWWTGVDLHNVREGKLDAGDQKKLEKARAAWLSQCGEIYVHVFKQFHTASIMDCRNILIDLLKECDIGLVLFDYLEKFAPGDGQRYSTGQDGVGAKKLAVAEKIINIATEFNIGVGTVTQASNIEKEFWNNPNFVITRENISNLKATIDPFPYCITLNQTDDENDKEIMRIHEEKLRHYATLSYTSTYPIAQRRDIGRFIDLPRTNLEFWDSVNKKIIRTLPVKK